ncbi:MAG: Maf family nucleotide pyrophosphatase [Myxococcota bacterium]
MPTLVLASTSPYRAKILTDAGIPHTTCAPGVDESRFVDPDPAVRAVAIAVAKARAVDSEHLVLAADQVVFDPETGEVFGKPKGPGDHVDRLLAMRGRCHHLVTGFAIRQGDRIVTGVETTRLWIRQVEESEIRAYVAHGEGAGCAGGYAAEGIGGFLVDRVEGDWLNVIGLPLYRVFDTLRDLGWRFGGR